MGHNNGGLGRRIKIVFALTVLCVSAVGMSGCDWDEGYIKDGGKNLGEWTQASGGILVVLYHSTAGSPDRNVNTSEAILALYKNYRQTHNIQGASVLTLRFMRRYCNDGGNPAEDYARARCLDALGDDEWSDFRNDSLVPVDHSSSCIAVHIRSGENWTTRSSSDRHCQPPCYICRAVAGPSKRGQDAKVFGIAREY